MKRLASFFASLFFTAAAFADAPVCGGKNLLDAMQAAKPATYAEVIAEAAATPNGEAIFWKIEGKGRKPSFLLGTAHVTDPRVVTLSPEIEAEIRNASTIALELAELRDPMEMAAATLKNASLMVLPPDQSLWDLIPDGDEPAIRNHPNLSGGDALFGYQPWIVAGMLSVPLCESQRRKLGLPTLDEIIGSRSVAGGTKLVGLETVTEQLSVFANMPLALQAKYLVAVARVGPDINDYFETLIRLYQRRQITAYMPFARRAETGGASPEDDAAMMAFVEEDILRIRNHRMAERAAGLFASGGAFVAVGALHLPGKEGLVELIRQQGYKVTPIN